MKESAEINRLMLYQYLKVDIENRIGILTLNRPDVFNAMCLEFFHEMDVLLGEVVLKREINALVITGEGEAFSAGGDISEMIGMSPGKARQSSRIVQASFNKIENIEIPVIAAVNGYAIGGGCELAMACDIRIASTEAKFGLPEVNMGVIPGGGGSQRLPRLIGLSNALYMLLTARLISAQEAFRIHLVQKVVSRRQLMDEAMGMAKKITHKDPDAIRRIKSVTRAGLRFGFEKGCQLESEALGSLLERIQGVKTND